MKARNLGLVVLLAVLVACSSTASTGEEILAGTVDTAYVIGDVGEMLFWRIPSFFVWHAPKALLYDLPREGILAVRGNRAQVEALIGLIESGELTVEDEVAAADELRELTGLPIASAERWLAWWEVGREIDEGDWRTRFVTDAIDGLLADDYFTRASALEDLKALYGTSLEYDPKARPEVRRNAADRWREHFEKSGLPPRN